MGKKRQKHKSASKTKKLAASRIVLSVIGLLVLVLVAATVGYNIYFAKRALPQVSLAGASISGQDRNQIASELTKRANEITISLSANDQIHDLRLADLGVTVDVPATVNEVFDANEQIKARFQALAKKRAVEPVIRVDAEAQKAKLSELFAGEPAIDAKAELGSDGRYLLSASKEGYAVDDQEVAAVINEAAKTLTSKSLTLETKPVDPKISDEQAQQAVELANKVLDAPITISGINDSYSPSVQQRQGWISFGGEPYQMTLNADQITDFVNQSAEADTVEPVNGIRRVTSDGKQVGTLTDPVDGQAVNNVDQVRDAITTALTSGEQAQTSFTHDVTKAQIQERVIAAGAENLAYPAAPGEKWIDVNLGNNTVSAYEGATAVKSNMLMVPGAPGMETPTGTFKVYLQYDVQTMRGTNPDGTKYVQPGVQWVSYFTGDIAFHSAPWQKSFGWSGPGGSHGCVNMSTADAHFIHDWSDIGTTVVSHY